MMIHVMSYQIAIFFKNRIDRPDIFLSTLNDSSGNLFDKMPQIIPLPDDIPEEFPRVSSRSSSEPYFINIALKRMEFTLNVIDSKKTEQECYSDFILKSKLIINSIPGDISINRIGLIGNYFYSDKNPSLALARRFLKKDLGNISEFNLRFNKPFEEFGFEFNNILSIGNVNFILKNIESSGVYIQRDINNTPAKNKEIGKNIAIDILNNKVKMLSSSLIEEVI
ncbi:hypothetical protein JEK36_26425 [Klebsiella pneumoniae]|uniref:hypothetical protein n=1 Tax=Klebsiella pneumoniae TaxID=573 RepID=UPI00211739E6|nr:hypothetical protein [Klebsiella pneumoniae]MCQ8497669.1 hypothetical protein [Klebsiella pneumoniae]HCE8967005.1 hypothetical protein [Klebsiella pneumoniae]HCG2939301.1 hypothetical protein [Klebsiella pneumoniae]HCH7873074.1 hypothetical protein [Klebsiella pneumoniae]